jgi:hypothetical protein
VEKTKRILRKAGAHLRRIVADSQYSSKRVRKTVDEAVIPYPSNQKRGVKGILRVDKKFRTHGRKTRRGSTISDRLWKQLSAS